jgi:hypothetical protein
MYRRSNTSDRDDIHKEGRAEHERDRNKREAGKPARLNIKSFNRNAKKQKGKNLYPHNSKVQVNDNSQLNSR